MQDLSAERKRIPLTNPELKMTRAGDVVMYKDSNDSPPRYGVSVHPAIVTACVGLRDGVTLLDLTVLIHGCSPEPRMGVVQGTLGTDTACWWPRV